MGRGPVVRINLIVPAMPWRFFRKDRKTGRHELVEELHIGGFVDSRFQKDIDRLRRFNSWKQWATVRLAEELRRAGYRDPSPMPSAGWKVTTAAFFPTGIHVDPCNVHKLIEDVLVGRRGKSSTGRFLFLEDRNLAGEYRPPVVDPVAPRVEVTIERVGKA